MSCVKKRGKKVVYFLEKYKKILEKWCVVFFFEKTGVKHNSLILYMEYDTFKKSMKTFQKVYIIYRVVEGV